MVRLSIVPPAQKVPNGHPLLPKSYRLLVPTSDGCSRVQNADIQVIWVKIKLLFFGETVVFLGPGLEIAILAVCATPDGGIRRTEGCGLACASLALGLGLGLGVALKRAVPCFLKFFLVV